ncbi:alkaline phosphatase D family protein [Marinilabilia rubra]|uniref:Alkaline phosphatase n=1 Tax=Marinilabilia rubra TaxID=2162893 RepID=A0A2U2B946_9BACT|nr:alkaline phosphatase D family protein [Marinilabilia rubra]PWD99572.1 hypothetical protein DDZ16_08950 [Marinilabilia rubra]
MYRLLSALLVVLSITGFIHVTAQKLDPVTFNIETTELNDSIAQGLYHGHSNIRKNIFRLILEGKNEEARARIEKYGESKGKRRRRRGSGSNAYQDYYKSVFLIYNNRLDEAWQTMQKAMENGIPFETFMAGPRSMLQNIYHYPRFRDALRGRQLIHGPMVGAVTSSGANFWARTWREIAFKVMLSDSKEFSNPVYSRISRTNSDFDFTGTSGVNGLKPDTRYYYKLVLDGEIREEVYTFKTYPEEKEASAFRIAFGGCSNLNKNPDNERMWSVIRNTSPLAFVQLGDNTYIDDPTGYEYQRSSFYRRHSNPHYRELMSATSNYAIYDDHDFSLNDCVSSPDPDLPEWKVKVLKIFKENFPAPYYGNGKKNGGAYTHFSIGEVDFFILDCRYFRDNPLTAEAPSMLGQEQKQWFFDLLKNSTAKFKVVFTSVPVAPDVSGKELSCDSWDGFPGERDEIFTFIKSNQIEGVIFAAGDRHRADARMIQNDGLYDIPEFLNSRLTNSKGYMLVEEAEGSRYLFGYNELPHFGLLDFDTQKDDPEVSYTIININNEKKGKVTIRLSDLEFKP